jgi:hypothetical protein
MRVRFQRLLFARNLGLSLAAWAAPALGQVPEQRELSESPPQFVFGSVQCPDPKVVQQAVLSLIPPEHYAQLGRSVRVELEDLADTYRVTVLKDGATVKKRYSDPARDCESRARFAAVFAVLTLMPPELGLGPIAKPETEPAPQPAPTQPTLAPEPVPRPRVVRLVRLELSASYAYAPAILEAPSLNSLGGELRVAVGRAALSGTLSVAYAQRARFELGSVQGDLARLPFSAGARLRSDFGVWSLTADLGLALVLQRVRATNLLTQHTESSLDIGVRAGIQVAREAGPHFAPFIGAFLWLSPAPSQISVLPQGVIGNLPYLWLGGAAGVSFGL